MDNADVVSALLQLRDQVLSGVELTLDQSLALDRAINHFAALDEADLLDIEQPD